jgi:hypothetical protein
MASYCTRVSFNVISQAPVALGIGSTIFDDPCLVSVPAGHATVSESVSVDGELTVTCIGPTPVNDFEADEASGSWRSPVHVWESAAGCAGAAALDPLVDGVVVVVVVVVAVVAVATDVTVLGGVAAAGVVEVALAAERVALGTMSLEAAEVVSVFGDVVVDVVGIVVDVVGVVPFP